MTLLDAGLVGALAVVVLYFAVKTIREFWGMMKSLTAALKAVPNILDAMRDVRDVARDFLRELQLMRTIATGGPAPNFGVDQGEVEEHPAPAQPRTPAEWPKPPFDMYPIKREAPDAEKDDTVVFAQNEADMAEEERLENLIDAGLAYREEVQPEGREVESE